MLMGCSPPAAAALVLLSIDQPPGYLLWILSPLFRRRTVIFDGGLGDVLLVTYNDAVNASEEDIRGGEKEDYTEQEEEEDQCL
jgi:hypothetical protein